MRTKWAPQTRQSLDFPPLGSIWKWEEMKVKGSVPAHPSLCSSSHLSCPQDSKSGGSRATFLPKTPSTGAGSLVAVLSLAGPGRTWAGTS